MTGTQNPFMLFRQWFDEASHNAPFDPTAFTLSTVDRTTGFPSSRVVLLKEHDDKGFVYFTNYLSAKGREIAANPKVSMCFFWPWTQKQIRISGMVQRVSDEKSEAYFATRPFESQIGALVSKQSQTLKNHAYFLELYHTKVKELENTKPQKPEHWGGFQIIPESFEFWENEKFRLHKRTLFTKENGDDVKLKNENENENIWAKSFLFP